LGFIAKKVGFGSFLGCFGVFSGLFGCTFYRVASLMCRLQVVNRIVTTVHQADDVVCCVGSGFAA
jgi:hypothetical protein